MRSKTELHAEDYNTIPHQQELEMNRIQVTVERVYTYRKYAGKDEETGKSVYDHTAQQKVTISTMCDNEAELGSIRAELEDAHVKMEIDFWKEKKKKFANKDQGSSKSNGDGFEW